MNDTPPKDPESIILLMAVVQSQDAEAAESALVKADMTVGRLPSAGGFLGRRNVTLLIGLPYKKLEQANELLNKNCRQRIEYIAVPLESAPLPMPAPTPITIGGATIFALDVDHFEEF